jgi:subtilisin family serine protease
VAGVSWYSRILPVKVLSAGGSGSWEAVANGITFAADAGAQVLSLSLGGGSSTLVEDAVNYAYDLDCIILSASGNDNSGEAFYPASYTNSVSVGANEPVVTSANLRALAMEKPGGEVTMAMA